MVRNYGYSDEGDGAQEEANISSDFIRDIDNESSDHMYEHNISSTPDTIWVRITSIFVIIFQIIYED